MTGVGMKILSWMITDEMKLTENYWMYAVVFGIDIPTNQSQPIESTQGTHRTTSAPRTPNPDVDEGESSAQRKKSHDDFEAKQNEKKVKEHLMAEEIEKLVEGTENVENNKGVNSVLNNQEVLGTRLEPMSNKESPEVEITVAIQPANVNEVMEESLPKMVDDHVKELTKTQVLIYVAEGLIMERQQNQADMAKMIDDPHDDAHPEGENSAKRQKMTVHGTYVFRESSSNQVNKSKPGPSTSGNQEQLDDFDIWTNTDATDDDELPTEKVSQELVEEMSQTVDEAKLCKVVNEMLTQ
ncbi:hypothetical protein Tco_0110860 [Tanacetum coccineum]